MGKFRIGQFDIDGSRCKVSSTDSEVIIEPKVMDVLQFLYDNRGTVMSQEAIFSKVWPNSTFSPSSVQRSIAILRKALNEDSKTAQFIITHPKRGYSLELPSELQDETDRDKEVEKKKTKGLFLSGFATAFIGLVSIFIAVLMYTGFAANPNSVTTTIKTEFSRLSPITSNEANESYPALSHDGRFLAFVRGDDSSNHIWLKDLPTGREVKFSESASRYSHIGWSPDDSALVFIESINDEHVLAYANVDKIRLSASGQARLLKLEQTYVGGAKLQWGNDGLVYFVEINPDTKATSLTSINLSDNTRTVIKASEGQDWLLTLALSKDNSRMALAYEAGQNRYRVDVLDLSDASVATLLTLEDGIQGLSWHPNNQVLLVSQHNKLLLVNGQGQQSRLDFDNYRMIKDATFDASGQEILMELVSLDFDIAMTTRGAPDHYQTLVDTAAEDFLPIFSPDSSKFVFESRRAGLKQLFVYENGQQRLVFSNPENEELFGVVWSKDGEEIIAASKDKLFRIQLQTGQVQTIPHPHHSFYLREMFHNEDAILVSYREENGSAFNTAKLDLKTLTLDNYTASGKRLACISMGLDESDRIYFANHDQVFKIDNKGDAQPVWQSNDQTISGLSVKNQTLSLKLDKKNEYQVVNVSLLDGAQELVLQGKDDDYMLTNASHDHQQFLYITKPEMTKTLVRLK